MVPATLISPPGSFVTGTGLPSTKSGGNASGLAESGVEPAGKGDALGIAAAFVGRIGGLPCTMFPLPGSRKSGFGVFCAADGGNVIAVGPAEP